MGEFLVRGKGWLKGERFVNHHTVERTVFEEWPEGVVGGALERVADGGKFVGFLGNDDGHSGRGARGQIIDDGVGSDEFLGASTEGGQLGAERKLVRNSNHLNCQFGAAGRAAALEDEAPLVRTHAL